VTIVNLPLGVLSTFPVLYPEFAIGGGGLDALRSRRPPARWRNLDGREISFANSFAHPRHTSEIGHGAIDIYAGFGCGVYSTVAGRVVEEWVTNSGRRPGVGFVPYDPTTPRDNQGGNYVMIEDQHGYHHYYAHMLFTPNLAPGAPIRVGQPLGRVGASGLPPRRMQHLHYQVSRRHGRIQFINPYDELRRLVERDFPDAPFNSGGRVEIPM